MDGLGKRARRALLDAGEDADRAYLERLSKDKNQSQIFIETPFRNDKMLADLKSTLTPTTKLCVACDITLGSEYIKTLSIQDWKTENPNLHKKPTIFIIHKN